MRSDEGLTNARRSGMIHAAPPRCSASRPPGRAACFFNLADCWDFLEKSALSAIQLLLQFFQFVAKPGVGFEFTINLADRVQNRCVIAITKAATDLGQ
jgi:hypothetical protein